VRFDDLKDPAPVPRDIDYASVIESDVPICGAAYATRFASGGAGAAEHEPFAGD
jgi:hypothetical protein